MTELWPWQREAVEFTSPLKGAILNCGMGVGKSLMSIELARRWGAKRVLIVGPKATVTESAWGRQFRDHGDGHFMYALLAKGNGQRKREQAEKNLTDAKVRGKTAVSVINYEALHREPMASHALASGYDLLVMDEVHKIKTPRGVASRFCDRLSRAVRNAGGRVLGLTGTLMPHSPMDVFAQMRAVEPSVFGTSFVRFRSRYAIMGGFEGRQIIEYQNLEELQARLRPNIFRVESSVLQHDEPLVSTVRVDLPAEAKRAYKSMKEDLIAEFEGGMLTAANGLVRLLRLQQLTSGYIALDDHEEATHVHSAKEDALKEILENTMEEPVVIFGRFVGDLQTAASAATAVDRPFFQLRGGINQQEAWDAMAQEGVTPAPVLAVQIQAGGTGIDLTAAGIAVYLSTGFNLGDFLQSEARLDRPGRQPIVRFIHVVAEGTIDVDVQRALRSRQNLVDGVLSSLTADLQEQNHAE